MPWPTPDAYHEAVQNPKLCFFDPELKAGTVAATSLGLPRVMSGHFASVYEIRLGAKRWAVRCFLHPVSDHGERYAQISAYLAGMTLDSLVGFEYQEQGIRLQGQTFPIVKMEWAEGEPLTSYVERHLADAPLLLALSVRIRELVRSLRECEIAHGDLQHGNILVTPQGQIRLVDYDAMFVPALREKFSPERGEVNYQHPQRLGEYDERLDNFSALVIYLSLQALSIEPDLWWAFHKGENLILAGTDFNVPYQSAAFTRLQGIPHPQIYALASALMTACSGKMSQVPEFEDVVRASLTATVFPPLLKNSSPSTPTRRLRTASSPVPVAPLTVTPSAGSNSPISRGISARSRFSYKIPIGISALFLAGLVGIAMTQNRQKMNVPALLTRNMTANTVDKNVVGDPPGVETQAASTSPNDPLIPLNSAPSSATPSSPQSAGTSRDIPPSTITIRTNPKDGATLILIPEGEFLSGASPFGQRTTTLRAYWIYKTPVTVAQYRKFCKATGRPMPEPPEWGWIANHPMVNVTRQEALDYCHWAGVNLPTTEQWEKAARGTDGRKYPWGNEWDAQKCANSVNAERQKTSPVGSFPRGGSPYGVLDMAGNVWQWCASVSESDCSLRGGSWLNNVETDFAATNQIEDRPETADSVTGFRCVLELSGN